MLTGVTQDHVVFVLTKGMTMKIVKRIIKTFAVLALAYGILCGGYLLGEHSYQPFVSATVPVNQGPSLYARANIIGIDVSHLNLVYGEPNAGNINDALGSFTAPNTITVKPGLNEHDTR